jgi:hypothetical protein
VISALNVITFVPDSGINVANSLKPRPALEVVKETVLQYLLARFGGYNLGDVMLVAAAATMVVTMTEEKAPLSRPVLLHRCRNHGYAPLVMLSQYVPCS